VKGVKPWEREGYTSKKKNKKAKKAQRKLLNAARKTMPENDAKPYVVGMEAFAKIRAAVKSA
jgi:hypothetical protein